MQHTAWGRPYKIIVKKRGGYGAPPGILTPRGPTETRVESEEFLLEVKFPSLDIDTPEVPTNDAIPEVGSVDNATEEEIAQSLRRRNNKLAPGSDMIRWKHLKILHKKQPTVLKELMNACLKYRVFLVEWKEAYISFIPKGDKPLEEPGSYRPISLLSCLGKRLETLIKNRLRDNDEDSQFGFRKGKSTEDCLSKVVESIETFKQDNALVATVSLDIRGAFDHVYHHRVIEEMIESKTASYLIALVRDYFRDRRVAVATKSRVVDRGCPQGSVLGPKLWNLVYNVVLRLLKMLGITTFAFADDTLLLIPAQTIEELQVKI